MALREAVIDEFGLQIHCGRNRNIELRIFLVKRLHQLAAGCGHITHCDRGIASLVGFDQWRENIEIGRRQDREFRGWVVDLKEAFFLGNEALGSGNQGEEPTDQAEGKVMDAHVPLLSGLSVSARDPPWARTTSSTIVNPRPEPITSRTLSPLPNRSVK